MFSGLVGCCHEAEVPLAVRGLYSADPREKNRSLQTLAQCPQQSKPSVQRIASLMYDPNVGVASSAAYALRKIDSHEARDALQVAEAVRDNKRRKR
jgi:HEAT repeat protein